MALFRRDLKNRLSVEDANPRMVEAEAGASVARVGQLKKETDESLAEVVAVEAEGELLTEEMEVLADEYQGLDKVRATLESFRSEGGMHPQAAAVLQAALEGFRVRLGMNVTVPSSESFGSSTDRMAMTEISIESLSDTMAKIWKAIKDAWNKMVDWVKGLFGKKKETAEKLKERFKALKEADAPKGSIPSDAGFDFSKTKDVLFKEKLIESSNEAVSFIKENINFGLSLQAAFESMKGSAKKTEEAATKLLALPPPAQSSNESRVSVEDASQTSSITKEAISSFMDSFQKISGFQKTTNVSDKYKRDWAKEYEESSIFFGGKKLIVAFGEENNASKLDVVVYEPEKREGKDGKLPFPAWGEVSSVSADAFKLLDTYSSKSVSEEVVSIIGSFVEKEKGSDNKEAVAAFKELLASWQKVVTECMSKADTAVIAGLGVVASYFEASKEAYKE